MLECPCEVPGKCCGSSRIVIPIPACSIPQSRSIPWDAPTVPEMLIPRFPLIPRLPGFLTPQKPELCPQPPPAKPCPFPAVFLQLPAFPPSHCATFPPNQSAPGISRMFHSLWTKEMEKLTNNSMHPRLAFGEAVYGKLPCQRLLIFPAALAPGRTNIYIPGFSDCFHVERLSKELFMWFQGFAVNFHFQLDPAFLQDLKVGKDLFWECGAALAPLGGGNVTFLFYLKDN